MVPRHIAVLVVWKPHAPSFGSFLLVLAKVSCKSGRASEGHQKSSMCESSCFTILY